MVLRSGIIIPFQFRDAKKLLMIGVPEENRDLSIFDLKNVVRAAFGIYSFEFRNKKIGFSIPDELLLLYLAQRHDLTNFIVEVGQANDKVVVVPPPSKDPLCFQPSSSSSQKRKVIEPQVVNESNENSDDQSDPPPPHKMRISQAFIEPPPSESFSHSAEDSMDLIPKTEAEEDFVASDTEFQYSSSYKGKRFYKEFTKIHARLDKIMEGISNLGPQMNSITQHNKKLGEASAIDSQTSLLQLLPISDELQLENLDTLLRSSNCMQRFIHEMSRFSGTSGRLIGKKVALKFIDKWFKRDFLIECSWTGIAKIKSKDLPEHTNVTDNHNNESKHLKKVNFSRFKRVIEAFHKVIYLADSRHSFDDTEDFLKKQLRNAYTRLKQLQSNNTKSVDENELGEPNVMESQN